MKTTTQTETPTGMHSITKEDLCSVEISMSTKGIATWTVKAYGEDLYTASAKAQEAHAALLRNFGTPAEQEERIKVAAQKRAQQAKEEAKG